MSTYRVEVEAVAREIYYIEAKSAEDAMERWHEGELEMSENSSGEPLSAEEVES